MYNQVYSAKLMILYTVIYRLHQECIYGCMHLVHRGYYFMHRNLISYIHVHTAEGDNRQFL